MNRFALLTAALFPLASLSAQEVTFRSSEWDSAAPILDITECYLTVKDTRKVRSARLNLEVYHKGRKAEWLYGTGISFSGDARPLDLKAALLFRHEEGKSGKGYLSLVWDDSRSASRFAFDQMDLPFAKGMVGGRFTPSPSEKMPIFYLLVDPMATGGYRSATTPEKLLELNPDCAVVIGYLILDAPGEAR